MQVSLVSVAMQVDSGMMIFSHFQTAVSIWSLLQEKLSKLLLSDDIKAVQVTLIALGHMCVKEPSLSHLNIALDLIFSLCRSKVSETLFL